MTSCGAGPQFTNGEKKNDAATGGTSGATGGTTAGTGGTTGTAGGATGATGGTTGTTSGATGGTTAGTGGTTGANGGTTGANGGTTAGTGGTTAGTGGTTAGTGGTTGGTGGTTGVGPGRPTSLVGAGDRKPNVVIILADDLGWNDISRNKGTTPTPNIDRLFEEGVELSNFTVYPVCSPTRAALMTGQNAAKLGMPDTLNAEKGDHLTMKEKTLANAFKEAGYATAIYGKWHLGAGPFVGPPPSPVKDTGPLARGFDDFFGFYGAATDSYVSRLTPAGIGTSLVDGSGTFAQKETGYTTDIFADKGVAFINAHKASPFFLYLPFNAVHTPIPDPNGAVKDPYLPSVAPPKPAGANSKCATSDQLRAYSALATGIDRNIKKIMDVIDGDQTLSANTIVFFFSDNGPALQNCGSAYPLMGGKHTLYEGGVHVPAAFRWKGKLKPGKISKMVAVEDVFQTVLSVTGNPIPRPATGTTRDGIDFSYNLAVAADAPTRTELGRSFNWTSAKDPTNYSTNFSFRTEQYKLIEMCPDISVAHYSEYFIMNAPVDPVANSRPAVQFQLFDLIADPNEQKMIQDTNPTALATMKKKLADWKATLPAQNKNPNP